MRYQDNRKNVIAPEVNAVRGKDNFHVGDLVAMVHRGCGPEPSWFSPYYDYGTKSYTTVVRITHMDDEMLYYEGKYGESTARLHRFFTDAGIEPYKNGYNDVNYTRNLTNEAKVIADFLDNVEVEVEIPVMVVL